MKILVFNGLLIITLLLGGGWVEGIWLWAAFTASVVLEK
jgi:hypothetical protein